MAEVIHYQEFKPRVKNTTSKSISVTFRDFDTGDPLDITNWAIRSQFRYQNKRGEIVRDVTDGNGITKDVINGKVTIDEFNQDWKVGTYWMDIRAVDGDQEMTYIEGSFPVLQNTTQEV